MKTETITLSKCCNATENDTGTEYICTKCHKVCELHEVCELCRGEGMVADEEMINGNWVGTNDTKCMCQMHEE